MPNLKWLEESVEPEINVNDLILSLEIRGIYKGHETRQQLVKTLGECLLLELECMGKDFSAWYKDFDKKARQLRRLHRENDVQKICFRTKTVWDELKELKQNIANAEQLEFEQASKQYFEVRNKILIAKAKMERQARESVEYAPIEDDRKDFHFNGLTARGPKLKHYQGRDALSEISVGSRHALAIHQTGKLFAWGVGSFGRLGHAGGTKDADDLEAWHKDYVKPTIVPSLEKTRFRSVACGFSHSMALSTRGQLYVWGSATAGKLGISHEEPSTPAQQQAFDIECFCFTPTILKIPGGRSIRKIACGPSHSAAISTNGELFVWGSGDGGRLGLGDERVIGQDFVPRHGNLGIVAVPTRVDFEPIASEHIVDVSCGIAHTAVISAVRSDKSALNGSNGSLNLTAKGYSGGKVFVAGSCFALGQFIPKFTQVKALESISIQSIACGASHTAAVSVEGELYTWGRNKTGCTGHSILLHEVAEPTLVDCMYRVPRDITRDTKYPSMASQSSQNAAFGPGWAITSDATPEGERSYSQTQQENCPYWEVKLGLRSRIEKIRVIVRKPPKEIVGDTLANFNYFILISDLPFEPEPGKYSLFKAKNQSIFMKVSNPFANYALATRRSPSRPGTSAGLQSTRGGSRPSTSTSRPGTSLVVAPPFEWEVPAGTFGRFVRIQLDSNNMLTLDRVEIIGYEEKEFRGSRVDSVTCSENLTIAICRPLKNQA
jgi:alpha-tubulin suppressor-like RCC1 family protein